MLQLASQAFTLLHFSHAISILHNTDLTDIVSPIFPSSLSNFIHFWHRIPMFVALIYVVKCGVTYLDIWLTIECCWATVSEGTQSTGTHFATCCVTQQPNIAVCLHMRNTTFHSVLLLCCLMFLWRWNCWVFSWMWWKICACWIQTFYQFLYLTAQMADSVLWLFANVLVRFREHMWRLCDLVSLINLDIELNIGF